MTYLIRRANADDQPSIRALVRSERLNPCGLRFPNFMLATTEAGAIGAAQIRRHRDGSRELGSVVVLPAWRGRRVAIRLIDALLADEIGSVFAITGIPRVGPSARWGFQPIDPATAPAPIRFNYRMGRMAGVISVIKGRPVNRLVLLERPPAGSGRPNP